VKFLLRLLGVLVAVLIGPSVTPTTVVHGAAFTYDFATNARIDVRNVGAVETSPAQPAEALEESASTSPEARSAPSTPSDSVVATNTIGIPSSSDTKLQNYIEQLYKHANKPGTVGNGTAMDAIPEEIAAGGGRHIQKSEEIARGLRKWLSRNRDAPYCDRLLAQSLYDELVAKLGYVP
jgi:hypothetical protein